MASVLELGGGGGEEGPSVNHLSAPPLICMARPRPPAPPPSRALALAAWPPVSPELGVAGGVGLGRSDLRTRGGSASRVRYLSSRKRRGQS